MQNHPAPLAASALFEDWISVREHASYDPLSRKAAVPYSYIWKRWCDWLQEQPNRPASSTYLDVSGREVRQFLLHGPSPCSGRKSRTAPISPVTRQRYGRVLRELYQHAVNFGHAATNPVTLNVIGTAPTEVERGGQILPPTVFEALYTVFPQNLTVYEKRDKAILLLLLESALTPGELRSLKLTDVRPNSLVAGQYMIHLDGPRGAQERSISTTGPSGEAMRQWLENRSAMVRKSNVVFISEKKGAMSRRALFALVAKMITMACQQVQFDVPNHIGPMVIRNNCIVRWYNTGKPVAEICRDAGFKDEKSFVRGLRVHLKPFGD